ncbi:hypothetical protein GCM10010440_13150 [Kitasatospora cinereorecta]
MRLVAAVWPVPVLVLRRAVLTVPSPESPATALRDLLVAVPVAFSAMAFDLIYESFEPSVPDDLPVPER